MTVDENMDSAREDFLMKDARKGFLADRVLTHANKVVANC